MGKKSKTETAVSTKNSSSSSDNHNTKKEAAAEGSSVVLSKDEITALLEKHVGPTLLTSPHKDPQSTSSLLEGTDIVGFYFAGSWSSVSKAFTPILIDFYNQTRGNNKNKDKKNSSSSSSKVPKLEIIYVSSDDDQESFHNYFATMPWLAMDGDDEGTVYKHNLATHLKTYYLPSLILLNVNTGHFITDQARKEVLNCVIPKESRIEEENDKEDDGGNKSAPPSSSSSCIDVEMANALIVSWNEREPVAIGSMDSWLDNLMNALEYFQKKPLMAVAIVAMLIFTPIIRRATENPILGVACYYALTTMVKEKMDRNSPYAEQLKSKKFSGVDSETEDDEKEDDKKTQ